MHALNMQSYYTSTFPKSQINLVWGGGGGGGGGVLESIENVFDKKTQFLNNINICTSK